MSFFSGIGTIFIVVSVAYFFASLISKFNSMGVHFTKIGYKLGIKYELLSLLFFMSGLFTLLGASGGFSFEIIVFFLISVLVLWGLALLNAYFRYRREARLYQHESFWVLIKNINNDK